MCFTIIILYWICLLYTSQSVENVTDIQLNEDDNNEWHIISNYNSWKTSKKTQLGNFTDIFLSLIHIYEDETNGVYGSASWSGTITESVVNLSTTIKEDTIGYFGEEINDFISVIGKDWAIENQVTAIKLIDVYKRQELNSVYSLGEEDFNGVTNDNDDNPSTGE